ncbi:hypothetical protein H4W79_004336 [Nocardiopsis terrae]|uniref:Uncharacterized protein n=1 Tax=Nocardiopsis terrae TaxID=372655 RepID=A0ABR9HM52_9ACTN|nr:hypothetical protein [Nocardiopsis terrae]
MAPRRPKEDRANTGNGMPYLAPAWPVSTIGNSTMRLPRTMVTMGPTTRFSVRSRTRLWITKGSCQSTTESKVQPCVNRFLTVCGSALWCSPGTARVPNGVGRAGPPRSLSLGPGTRIVCALRGRAAGSLTPGGLRWGLGGPRPAPIAPVGAGRCRPTPDRVPLGAPPDRDAGRIVPGRLAFAAGSARTSEAGTHAGGPPGGVSRRPRPGFAPCTDRTGEGVAPGRVAGEVRISR